METEKHGGLPQHRCRIYICGIRVDCQVREFVWPVEFPETLTLTQVLGPECCSLSDQLAALRNCDNLPQTAMKNFHAFAEVLQRSPGDYILDAGGSKPNFMLGRSPCLLASRCKGKFGYWSNARGRWLGPDDFLKLHGVPSQACAGWASVISPQVMGDMCGNAMSVGVVKRLVRAILQARGWLS